MAPRKFSDRCCNPFKIKKHKKKKNLRRVCASLQIQWQLNNEDRLCSACLKKIRQNDPPTNERTIENTKINDHEINVDNDNICTLTGRLISIRKII